MPCYLASMPEMSINELHKLTGVMRDTITRRLGDLEFVTKGTGKTAAKKYDPKKALPLIYGATAGGESGGALNTQQAAAALSVAKKHQIDIDIECKRKERIPVSDIETVNDEVFSEIAGMLKTFEGRVMTREDVNDIYARFRDIGAKVSELARA